MLIALLVPLGAGEPAVHRSFCVAPSLASGPCRVARQSLLGAITNFFDTLGIGSFAPTMAWFKFRKLVPDRLIPPTLLVGHSLPTMAASLHFPDPARCARRPGAARWLCDCPRSRWPGRRAVGREGQGLACPARRRHRTSDRGGILYTMTNLQIIPGGGSASSLSLDLTVIAIAANFIFGILLNFGIGHYAPSLVMLSLMGLDPKLAFPIMATGGALTIAGGGHPPCADRAGRPQDRGGHRDRRRSRRLRRRLCR